MWRQYRGFMWSGLQDPVSQVFVANIGEAHEDRTDGCGLTARPLCCGKDDLRSFFEDAGEVRAEGLVLYLRRQYYLSTTFTASSRLSCKNLTTSIYTTWKRRHCPKLIIFPTCTLTIVLFLWRG